MDALPIDGTERRAVQVAEPRRDARLRPRRAHRDAARRRPAALRAPGRARRRRSSSSSSPPRRCRRGGAKPMIDAGVLENPTRRRRLRHPHRARTCRSARSASAPGRSTAASDGFVDHDPGRRRRTPPARTAASIRSSSPAQCIVALQTLVSREVNPLRQAVITVGSLHAGTVSQRHPREGEMQGDHPHLRRRTCADASPAHPRAGAGHRRAPCAPSADVDYTFGYPTLVNDARDDRPRPRASRASSSARQAASSASPAWAPRTCPTSSSASPGCFFRVGSRNDERGLIYGHHHPRFDIDDEHALPIGVAAVASVALRYLNGE